MDSAVVLCSGGIDSILCSRISKDQGYVPILTHINYGQRTAEAEISAIRACCSFFKWQDPIVLDLNDIGRFGAGSLVSSNSEDDSLFPQRNLALVSIGSVVASMVGAVSIYIGITCALNPEFYDCSVAYIESMEAILSLSEPPIKLITPLARLSKHEVGRMCFSYNLPVDLTFSCNVGPDRHCQKCTSCVDRAIVMRAISQCSI